MTSKRPAILMAILLILVAAFVAWPQVQEWRMSHGTYGPPPPLAGKNSISNVALRQEADGRWTVHFDYFFTGEPDRTLIEVGQRVDDPRFGTQGGFVQQFSAVRGKQHYSGPLRNPDPTVMSTTTQVYVVMHDVLRYGTPRYDLVRASLDQRVQWPDPVVAQVQKALAEGGPEAVVAKAVALIDSGTRETLAEARTLLQALVERSPRTDTAYVELARVAMKTNWNPAGLREAEGLIRSALQIRPDSVNAKILLGYVLAHQERHADAERLFSEAAAANPRNLWLWSNWAELLVMQGRNDAAISKYREAIARPPTHDTYDRARQDAYDNVIPLLVKRNDVDAVEALYKQRTTEYPGSNCFSVEYARFLVLERADAVQGATVLHDTPSPQCDPAHAREVQGLAYYVAWSGAADDAGNKPDALLQARVFLPSGPNLFYALASSERTVKIAQQLIAAGDKVDAQDNRGYDALGYALRAGDGAVVRRLLRLGAKPTTEEGAERMPAALIPVLTRDAESVRLLQRAGVDYARVRFQGASALDIARSSGDRKLLLLLEGGGRAAPSGTDA